MSIHTSFIERKCKECQRTLPLNIARSFCDRSCYAKFRYKLRKPIRMCVYCKHVITGTSYKYCTVQHRKFYERLLRARKKVKRLVENMNKARNGYRKEYKRIWAARNHEKVLQYNRRTYYKHRERILQLQKIRYQRNREAIILKNKLRRKNRIAQQQF